MIQCDPPAGKPKLFVSVDVLFPVWTRGTLSRNIAFAIDSIIDVLHGLIFAFFVLLKYYI